MIWRRSPSSRRLTLLLWAVVFLILFFRYRFSLAEVLSPRPVKSQHTSPEETDTETTRLRPEDIEVTTDSQTGVKHFIKGSFDWGKLKLHYPIPQDKMARLPKGPPQPLQKVQHNFHRGAYQLGPKNDAQREAIRNAFKRCWDSYIAHGFPRDELTPVTLKGKDTFGGWAATLIDSLDTLLIMGLTAEFESVLPFIGTLDWSKTSLTSINLFETTIRHLGGLLSAYDLSGSEVLFLKAIELGDLLYAAFDTPNHMPPFWLSFSDARSGRQKASTYQPSAGPASLSLEFTRLSQLTGNPKYYDAITRVTSFLASSQSTTALPGIWPTFLDFETPLANTTADFTLGAQADSLYEYLPKMSALLGGRDPLYEKMYRSAMATAAKHLLFRPMLPGNPDVLLPGDVHVSSSGEKNLITNVQHLGCFTGGMFGLGGKLFGIKSHVEIGEKLAKGCAWAYEAFELGIMPEIVGFIPCDRDDEKCEWNEAKWEKEGEAKYPKGVRNVRDPKYILRPEAIESVFLMWRMTGRKEWQDVAWRMWLAVESVTATEEANSAVEDVTVGKGSVKMLDSMESFWMAETLKYFYLIFSSPDLISLDEYVFNTEAHPLKRADR
ncbi:hypothetical protein OQA88_12087 [Cercophora sp. LCS_1]